MKAIIFDFDGVIVDSFPANYIPASMKYEGLSEEEYKTWFFGNIYEKKTHRKPREVNHFDEYKKILLHIPVNEGFPGVLKKIKEKYLLFINSSTPEEIIREYLQKYDLDKMFEKIVGYNYSKSKVEKFRFILKEHNLDAADCVFVTDTLGDVLEAHTANIKSIAVDFGFHSRDILERGKPFRIISTVEELLRI